MEYKDSRFNSPNYLANMRLTKSAQDTQLFDEETVLQIQSEFHKLLQVDPSDINEEAQNILLRLENIINSDIYKNNLPSLVPYSVYPQIVRFLSETQDSRAYQIICRIVVALTNDVSSSLEELLNNNLFIPIDLSISNFKFPNSAHLLYQIIANYLSDPNEEISLYTHNKFSIEYLFKLFQYSKSIFSHNPELDPDNTLEKEIVNRWMKCIYTSISRYPKEVPENHATITLIEVNKYFDIVFEDALLCKHLCYTIISLMDANLLNYSDFNLYDYPAFLSSLSHYVSDDEVRAYAFTVIGKLIQLNRYCVAFNFLDFFNIIVKANESTSKLLLNAAFFVCKCCLDNHIIAQETFDTVCNNVPALIEFYESQNYNLRLNMNNLFSAFVRYFAEMKTDQIQQYGSAIFSITDIFFDFLPYTDDFELTFPTLEALCLLNNYLIDHEYIDSAITADYTSRFIDCMTEMQRSDDQNISELTGKMLLSLNEKQKFNN